MELLVSSIFFVYIYHMKTIEEIIKQDSIFLDDWAEATTEDILNDFNAQNYIDPEDIKILFASYTYANYEGNAWVLFAKDNQLFEINGGHCSCYGLENQWDPEVVVLKELENRLINGELGNDYYGNWNGSLKNLLGVN